MGTRLADAFRDARQQHERGRDKTGKAARGKSPSRPGAPGAASAERAGAATGPAATIRREAAADPPVRLTWRGEFRENPAFGKSQQRNFALAPHKRSGVEADLLDGAEPKDEADIWLGLDFGTSSVKAVIRDATGKQAFAVPFGKDQDGRFLLPTRVFENRTGFSLEPTGAPVEDLKLSLLQPEGRVEAQHLENACAFLALVVRHCRGWFLSKYAPRYRWHLLNWHVNVGLPARSCQDTELVDRFHAIAWSATNLAGDPRQRHVTREGVAGWLARWGSQTAGDAAPDVVPLGDVAVIPEIAAQMAGLVESRRWDVLHRPYFVLVDVGAGTLDCAFFGVIRNHGGKGHRFVFYASDVRPFGAINLHRARSRWLRQALESAESRNKKAIDYVDRIDRMAYAFPAFPESVRDYLPECTLHTSPGRGTIDDRFFQDGALAQVCTTMGQGKTRQQFAADALRHVPLVVCGGGSRMRFYGRLPDAINDAWVRKWGGTFSVRREEMTLPSGLEAPGLAASDHDRISVAYGLSLPQVGRIVGEAEIPPPPSPPRWQGVNFVSKDDV